MALQSFVSKNLFLEIFKIKTYLKCIFSLSFGVLLNIYEYHAECTARYEPNFIFQDPRILKIRLIQLHKK